MALSVNNMLAIGKRTSGDIPHFYLDEIIESDIDFADYGITWTCELDDNRIFIAYSRGSYKEYWYARIIKYNIETDSWTLGEKLRIWSSLVSYDKLDDGKLVTNGHNKVIMAAFNTGTSPMFFRIDDMTISVESLRVLYSSPNYAHFIPLGEDRFLWVEGDSSNGTYYGVLEFGDSAITVLKTYTRLKTSDNSNVNLTIAKVEKIDETHLLVYGTDTSSYPTAFAVLTISGNGNATTVVSTPLCRNSIGFSSYNNLFGYIKNLGERRYLIVSKGTAQNSTSSTLNYWYDGFYHQTIELSEDLQTITLESVKLKDADNTSYGTITIKDKKNTYPCRVKIRGASNCGYYPYVIYSDDKGNDVMMAEYTLNYSEYIHKAQSVTFMYFSPMGLIAFVCNQSFQLYLAKFKKEED